MTRKKIEIKKIDDLCSRQVTFSKRRKGLFKKAEELSTLCDADIALIVFSATNKLFHYASSSMQQVFEKHSRHSVIRRSDRPSIALQGFFWSPLHMTKLPKVERDFNYEMLRKQEEEKARELRHMNGEDLQGLTLQELQKLEELLIRGITTASKRKDEKLMQEIGTLKKKGIQLMEENHKLKEISRNRHGDQVQGHNSIEPTVCSSSSIPEEHGSDTDISLKLGLP